MSPQKLCIRSSALSIRHHVYVLAHLGLSCFQKRCCHRCGCVIHRRRWHLPAEWWRRWRFHLMDTNIAGIRSISVHNPSFYVRFTGPNVTAGSYTYWKRMLGLIPDVWVLGVVSNTYMLGCDTLCVDSWARVSTVEGDTIAHRRDEIAQERVKVAAGRRELFSGPRRCRVLMLSWMWCYTLEHIPAGFR